MALVRPAARRADELADDLHRGFELLPTGLRPHYTVRLRRADIVELDELLAALGPPVTNVQYARSTIWREEGRDVPSTWRPQAMARLCT